MMHAVVESAMQRGEGRPATPIAIQYLHKYFSRLSKSKLFCDFVSESCPQTSK